MEGVIMTSTQRRFVYGALLVMLLMGLYPPWSVTYDRVGTHMRRPAGYALITVPPPAVIEDSQGALDGPAVGVALDWSRLLLQWVLVGFTCLVLLVLTGAMRGEPVEDRSSFHRRDAEAPRSAEGMHIPNLS